ncbi:MAG: undecaprenyldiphospho-muramoylpentapeptide beta-N-acetylglucosaminyltransferase [Candidatus Omnitrophica bacterium]|nr:undecaprenyldiphospho-muramoylpentapeptide beta-N-acetylglucosaminyltransferase [Candidatus Omnitrophota bacterium]
MALRVLMAAGGTGGHVLPALTVARLLKQQDPGCSCVAVSGRRGVAAQWWDPALGELATVPVEPWPRRLQVASPRYWWRQARATVRMARLLRRYRPQVVVGFGGHVAGPAVLLAKLGGTPTVIHEQNVFPGRTTRWLAPWADRVAVSFEETRRHLPSSARVTVTGNPVREGVAGRSRAAAWKALGLSEDIPVLLIMGGSQGSHVLNTVTVEALARLAPADRRAVQLLHMTGATDHAWVAGRYRALGVAGHAVAALPMMGPAYAVATLAVARAGATTLAELVATSTPAVLVPYPHANAHQAVNAHWLGRRGGAVVMDQGVFTPERFMDVIVPLFRDAARLDAMRAQLQRLAVPGAAERVAAAVLEVAHAN